MACSKEDWEGILRDFEVDSREVEGAVPLYAMYDIDGYEGYAEVVYIRKGKIWLVTGSHCSCHGLEGQWDPEEMPYKALRHLATDGGYSFSGKDFVAMLDELDGLDLDGLSDSEIEFTIRMAL